MAKKQIVNKNYALINAKYRLTTVQSKIVLKVISLINNKIDTEFETYQLPLSTFDFLTNNKNHGRLIKECDKLLSKVVHIETDDGWLKSHWFSSIQYIKSKNIIECSIDPKLKPYLLQLKKNFKYYELHYIMKMNSEYSIRIYELLKQQQKFRKRKIERKEIENILEVPKSLLEYAPLRQKVLEVAVKEINKYSDIFISFEPIKKGRVVHEIEFKIETNEKNILEHKAEENELRNEVIKDFEKFKEMFVMYKFDLDDFEIEFESFKIFNDNKIDKVTLINFDKWCMQKRRKLVEKEEKNSVKNEQKEYRWNFRKAKDISDKLKKYLKFELGINYLDYYWEDTRPFTVKGISYDWRDVMHPDFNKNEILLFIVDEKDENSKYLLNYEEDIIDV